MVYLRLLIVSFFITICIANDGIMIAGNEQLEDKPWTLKRSLYSVSDIKLRKREFLSSLSKFDSGVINSKNLLNSMNRCSMRFDVKQKGFIGHKIVMFTGFDKHEVESIFFVLPDRNKFKKLELNKIEPYIRKYEGEILIQHLNEKLIILKSDNRVSEIELLYHNKDKKTGQLTHLNEEKLNVNVLSSYLTMIKERLRLRVSQIKKGNPERSVSFSDFEEEFNEDVFKDCLYLSKLLKDKEIFNLLNNMKVETEKRFGSYLAKIEKSIKEAEEEKNIRQIKYLNKKKRQYIKRMKTFKY